MSKYLRNMDMEEKVRELVGDEYEFLEYYIEYSTRIRMIHWDCGTKFRVSPDNFYVGQRCPLCVGRKRRTTEEFYQEVRDLVGDEYTFYGDLKRLDSKMPVTHNKCGHNYEVSPTSFITNSARCPNCYHSKGEEAVANVLQRISTEYIREYKFDELGQKRFDFYLPELNAVIEYDGEQHFEPVELWGGEENLKKVQESDKIKDEFCASESIGILRIPYWEIDKISILVEDFIERLKGD